MSKPTTHFEHVAAAENFKASDFLEPFLSIDPSQKWIAVSQLQKCIRRGEGALAIEWAHALWQADRSYGLFRLAVIAGEEIAGANPALARSFLETEIKKDWFEQRGGFPALAYFVDAFAGSIKDRASCDLASVASLAHLGDAAAPRGPLDYPKLRAIAEDAEASIPCRVSALWLLAGTQKSPNAALGPDRQGRLVDFLGACNAIHADQDTLVCIDLSLRLNKEPNPIALALCRAAQAARPGVVADVMEAPTRREGIGLTCAVDAHTREGRAAIDALIAREAQAKRMCSSMGSKADKSKLLGSIFFRLEGHDVSPRLDYALAARAHEWHRKRLARLAKMPEAELFALAIELLPRLDELRMEAAPWAFAAAPSKTPKPAA